MKRAILIVIDSMGIGAMPDAPDYGDTLECNTLCNVAKFNKGLNVPNFEKLGLGNIKEIEGIKSVKNPLASYGIMKEISQGKDTTTGHWEMAGLILDEPFKVYPQGFPPEVTEAFIKITGCGGILGNYAASGTVIIEELGELHAKTRFPIIYTSADSVFQIACDIDVIPLETLYDWCQKARELLKGDYNVSRIIARPYKTIDGKPQRISKDRRDYSIEPYKPTILNNVSNENGLVLGIGKIEDIFVKSGITHAIHTGCNKEGLELTLKAIKRELDLTSLAVNNNKNSQNYDKEFIFTNLVDTDMLFGHRNDPVGYAKAIEEIDLYLPEIMNSLNEDDLLIFTADHGCDPTVEGTDHTREYVPVLVYSKNLVAKNLEIRNTFSDVAATIKDWLEIKANVTGESML